MSIFNSINICSPKSKMISLQEESPEISFNSKKSSLSAKSKPFPLQSKSFQNMDQFSLFLSLDITSNYPLSVPPLPKMDEFQKISKNIFLGSQNNKKRLLADTNRKNYF